MLVLRKQKFLKMEAWVQPENLYLTLTLSELSKKGFFSFDVFGVCHVFVTSWEIERCHLQLADVIGEGAFGRVLRAKIVTPEADTLPSIVAVKMLKGKKVI